MASLYHIKCHKTLDQHNEVKVVVVLVVYFQDLIASVEHTEQEVLKIHILAISGDQED
jgi:hypothetical protein